MTLMIDCLLKRFDLVDTLEHVLNSDEVFFFTIVAEAKISSTNKYISVIDWSKGGCCPFGFHLG